MKYDQKFGGFLSVLFLAFPVLKYRVIGAFEPKQKTSDFGGPVVPVSR
jgi:hypothetical protein